MTPATPQPRHPLALLKRLWQQEQYVRVRIETERDSEARAAGLGQPVMVAYHRQMITHHESELGVLKWLIEAAQEQEVELTALRAQAEAEANKERTYRLALLGLQRQDTGCWCRTLTGGHAPECLQARAALAQAGDPQ